jgi:hypothetical protein
MTPVRPTVTTVTSLCHLCSEDAALPSQVFLNRSDFAARTQALSIALSLMHDAAISVVGSILNWSVGLQDEKLLIHWVSKLKNS